LDVIFRHHLLPLGVEIGTDRVASPACSLSSVSFLREDVDFKKKNRRSKKFRDIITCLPKFIAAIILDAFASEINDLFHEERTQRGCAESEQLKKHH
jgi:hypothetical protein